MNSSEHEKEKANARRALIVGLGLATLVFLVGAFDIVRPTRLPADIVMGLAFSIAFCTGMFALSKLKPRD